MSLDIFIDNPNKVTAFLPGSHDALADRETARGRAFRGVVDMLGMFSHAERRDPGATYLRLIGAGAVMQKCLADAGFDRKLAEVIDDARRLAEPDSDDAVQIPGIVTAWTAQTLPRHLANGVSFPAIARDMILSFADTGHSGNATTPTGGVATPLIPRQLPSAHEEVL